MKYIRTKDGIYEVKDDFIILKEQELYLPHFQDHIIAQSDTVEELCDELVLKDLDTEMCFVMSAVHIQDIRDNWKNLMDNDYLKNHTIYGAIWTDKGLIYVAKMNDKGELELL